MAFKNILVPYDDSECSLHAFKIAADELNKAGFKAINLDGGFPSWK